MRGGADAPLHVVYALMKKYIFWQKICYPEREAVFMSKANGSLCQRDREPI